MLGVGEGTENEADVFPALTAYSRVKEWVPRCKAVEGPTR